MRTNKHVAKLIDRQNVNKMKHLYRSITNINIELAKIHKNIEFDINKKLYKHATDYVNQYISFTSIWNLKFVYNFENPEVALMQLFHLEYIFEHEPKNRFKQERNAFAKQYESFLETKIYPTQHINLRKQKMLDYIKQQKNKENEDD